MADTAEKLLSLLVSILTQTFFTFVSGHFMPFMLLSVWHNCKILMICCYFTEFTNSFEGLKAGML